MRLVLPMVLLIAGCSEELASPYEGAVEDPPDLRLEVIYAAALGGGQVEVGGLDGAASPGATLTVEDAPVIADARGRFRVTVAGEAGDVVRVSSASGPWSFRVRDVEAARRAIVHPALGGGAGDVPNDLRFIDSRAVLVRSADNAVSVFEPPGELDSAHGIRLPPGDPAANPWFVAVISDVLLAVTSQQRHRVYFIDLVTDQVTPLDPPVVPLPRPFALSRPFDVDGDGAPDSVITSLRPRSPQGIAVVGRRLVAAFSGFVDTNHGAQTPALFVPGVVVSWSLDDTSIPPAVHVTPALDPQELTAHGDGQVILTMSGAVALQGDGRVTTSTGAVQLLDATTLAVARTWELGDFAPTTAMISGDALWVGSLAQGRVRALSLEGAMVADLRLNDEAVDSVFRFVALPGGLIGAGSNNTDLLHVIDPVERSLHRLPFGGPIAVGPGRPLYDGLQITARRPGRAGVDFVGPDLYALMRASRIIPLELRKVLGP